LSNFYQFLASKKYLLHKHKIGLTFTFQLIYIQTAGSD